jgi:hypothetical protein
MTTIAFLGPTASAPTATATTQLDVLRKVLVEFDLVEGHNIVIARTSVKYSCRLLLWFY